MAQLVTRIDDTLARALDELVNEGAAANRSELVRTALRRMVEDHRRAREAQQQVEAYRRLPQTEEEMGWADQATIRMIAEEPW